METEYLRRELEKLFRIADSSSSVTSEELDRIALLLDIPNHFVPDYFESEIRDFRGLSPLPILEVKHYPGKDRDFNPEGKNRTEFLKESLRNVEGRYIKRAISDAEKSIDTLRKETRVSVNDQRLLEIVSYVVQVVRSRISSAFGDLDTASRRSNQNSNLSNYGSESTVTGIGGPEKDEDRGLNLNRKGQGIYIPCRQHSGHTDSSVVAESISRLKGENTLANNIYRRYAKVWPVFQAKKRVYQRMLRHMEAGGEIPEFTSSEFVLGTKQRDAHLARAAAIIRAYPGLSTFEKFNEKVEIHMSNLGIEDMATPGESIKAGIVYGFEKTGRSRWENGYRGFAKAVLELEKRLPESARYAIKETEDGKRNGFL